MKVGLPSVIADLTSYMDTFIPLYKELMAETTDWYNNISYLANIPVTYNIEYDTDVGVTLLIQVYQVISDDFKVLIDHQNSQRTSLVAAALVVTVFLGVLSWLVVIRNLSKKEFEGRELLALVPVKLVLENFELKMYIIKNYLGKNDREHAKNIIKG